MKELISPDFFFTRNFFSPEKKNYQKKISPKTNFNQKIFSTDFFSAEIFFALELFFHKHFFSQKKNYNNFFFTRNFPSIEFFFYNKKKMLSELLFSQFFFFTRQIFSPEINVIKIVTKLKK